MYCLEEDSSTSRQAMVLGLTVLMARVHWEKLVLRLFGKITVGTIILVCFAKFLPVQNMLTLYTCLIYIFIELRFIILKFLVTYPFIIIYC